VILKNQCHID
jgi:hypothetical protein